MIKEHLELRFVFHKLNIVSELILLVYDLS